MSVLQSEELYPGVRFHAVSDERFKTNQIEIHLVTALREESAAKNALIPSLLRKGYDKYRDFTRFNKYLNLLYGASVEYEVEKFGDMQILSLSILSIDDRFALGKENITEQISTVLFQMLLHPVTENGMFLPAEVEVEKQSLIDEIEAEINDKRMFALRRTTQLLCGGEPYGLSEYGTVEQVKALDAKQVTRAYHELLSTAQMEILFVGSGDSESCKRIAKEQLRVLSRGKNDLREVKTEIHSPLAEPMEQVDRMEVSQSKMVLGFSTGIPCDSEQLYALRLMVVVLGGTPMSKLFANVREKLSLCYYCAARMDRTKGIVKIDSGVENENIEKAKTEILRQIEEMQNGNITEEELNYAKLSMINSYRSVNDSNASIESYYLGQILCGTANTPEEEAKKICAVTKEDVVWAANQLRYEICYLLTGKEN
ncbi:EF-P 5-aminopentanol modification-associated protein YfmF [Massiliimalia massiliensis]|uniref:EF-P 5-aminopentanol modification-associated protein YfmF n=1 Tax=Massiliimalia massiliensis TaxID=1852384 RepID=UPI000984EC9B|nr:pitrilysin family protein [Massiliimalia massiliensis]